MIVTNNTMDAETRILLIGRRYLWDPQRGLMMSMYIHIECMITYIPGRILELRAMTEGCRLRPTIEQSFHDKTSKFRRDKLKSGHYG